MYPAGYSNYVLLPLNYLFWTHGFDESFKRSFDFLYFQSKQTIERMQTIISSECRFRILRDALHR